MHIYPSISRVQCSQGAEAHRAAFLPPLQLHGLRQAGVIYRESFGKAALELPLAPTPGNSQLLQKIPPQKKKILPPPARHKDSEHSHRCSDVNFWGWVF